MENVEPFDAFPFRFVCISDISCIELTLTPIVKEMEHHSTDGAAAMRSHSTLKEETNYKTQHKMLRFLNTRTAQAPLAMAAGSSHAVHQQRGMKVRLENVFANEAVPHARRVSWAPLMTPKKQGIFARLSRSNLYDRPNARLSQEPYCEEEVEAHRAAHVPDVYVYKYNVTPTHMSLRP
jgi:hypothetical protein